MVMMDLEMVIHGGRPLPAGLRQGAFSREPSDYSSFF
jgi:hypothetical protein